MDAANENETNNNDITPFVNRLVFWLVVSIGLNSLKEGSAIPWSLSIFSFTVASVSAFYGLKIMKVMGEALLNKSPAGVFIRLLVFGSFGWWCVSLLSLLLQTFLHP